MFLLNLNYWGANQVILQRALAAKNLRHAQIGLLVGGLMKYLMVLIIIIPGIALAGILHERPLNDPDLTYLTLVNEFLPVGIRGLILAGLFASLMSTLDSIYNSVATLWSIDIYRRYMRPDASEAQVVRAGKLAVVTTFFTGILFGFIVVYVKFDNSAFALTHWFNELSYYVKNGFVVLVLTAVFLVKPPRTLVFYAILFSVLLTYLLKIILPEMNYFVRSGWVILCTFASITIPTVWINGWRRPEGMLFVASSQAVAQLGTVLAISLLVSHIMFH